MTTTVEAPPRNLYDAGQWLTDRHPDLAKLCNEIGAVSNGRVEMRSVRECLISYDSFVADRAEYNRRNGIKGTPDSMSITLGPQPSHAASRMMCMLPSQIACLRLLATLAPGTPAVLWGVDNLAALGAGSDRLLFDWVEAVRGFAAP